MLNKFILTVLSSCMGRTVFIRIFAYNFKSFLVSIRFKIPVRNVECYSSICFGVNLYLRYLRENSFKLLTVFVKFTASTKFYYNSISNNELIRNVYSLCLPVTSFYVYTWYALL